MTQPISNRKRKHAQPNGEWQLTDRDLDILTWVGRHGVVTAEQVSRRFFSAQRTAYIRIRKLVELRLLLRDRWYWNMPWLIRVTPRGARLADIGVHPAALVYSQAVHGIAVVDLITDLERANPDADVITERELRAGRRHRDHEVGRGRIPDGALRFADGRVIGIELDRTPKRSRQYLPLLRAYAGEGLTGVWWFAPNGVTAERLRALIKREFLDDLITVYMWPR